MLTHCHTPNSRLGPAQAPRSSKLLPGASPRAAGALPRRLKPARSLPVPPPPGAEDAGEETKFEQRQRLKESVGQGAFGGGAADEGAQQAAGGGAAQGAQRGGAEGQGSLPWSARASPATRVSRPRGGAGGVCSVQIGGAGSCLSRPMGRHCRLSGGCLLPRGAGMHGSSQLPASQDEEFPTTAEGLEDEFPARPSRSEPRRWGGAARRRGQRLQHSMEPT